MRKFNQIIVISLVSVLVIVVGWVSVAFSQDAIEVVVSPKTLNLNSNGGSVSIHTDVNYGSVIDVALEVDGQDVDSFFTFADDRGDLVVKCDIDLIKGLVMVGEAEFVLAVQTADGLCISSDTIDVIDRGK